MLSESKKLRLLLITQDDPFYLPLFFDHFLSSTKDTVLAIAVLPPLNTGLLTVAKRLYNLYGLKDFLFLGFKYAKTRLLDMLGMLIPLKRFYSIGAVARKHGIKILRPGDANSGKFLKYTKEILKPDLIISVSASQIFRGELLRIPPLGCINLHAGPLPRYAGMMPGFWAMAKGEKETAVTLHSMTEKLDEGQIFMQWPLPILPEDTHHSLLVKNKELGYKMLLQYLEDLKQGKVTSKAKNPRQKTYFHFPGRKDAMEFRKRGKKFW